MNTNCCVPLLFSPQGRDKLIFTDHGDVNTRFLLLFEEPEGNTNTVSYLLSVFSETLFKQPKGFFGEAMIAQVFHKKCRLSYPSLYTSMI